MGVETQDREKERAPVPRCRVPFHISFVDTVATEDQRKCVPGPGRDDQMSDAQLLLSDGPIQAPNPLRVAAAF